MSIFSAQECLLSSLLWILGSAVSLAQSAPPFTLEQLPVVGRPDSLATGDINGDGIPDVVGMDSTYPFENAPTPLLVYLGTPSGALVSSSIPIGVFHPRHSLQLADLDLDGDLDVALAHLVKVTSLPPGVGGCSLLKGHQLAMSSVMGDGGGSFTSSLSGTALAPPGAASIQGEVLLNCYLDFGSPQLDPNGLQLADWNSDGRPDAVVSAFIASYGESSFGGLSKSYNFGNYIYRFLLGGQGSWAHQETKKTDYDITVCFSGVSSSNPPCTLPAPTATFAATSGADWNNDGRVDTVYSTSLSTRVFINMSGSGLGSALFTLPYQKTTGSTTGDWNDDGLSDIVISRTGGIRFILGSSTPSVPSILEFPEFGDPAGLMLTDLNRDGVRDVAFLNRLIPMLGVRLTTAHGVLAPASTIYLPTVYLPGLITSSRVVDTNSDGQTDIYTVPSPPQSLYRLRSNWPVTASTSSFGSGTLGCSGTHGVQALSAPTVGNSGFRVACTNVPSEALGLCIVSDTADIAGTDSLGVGLAFHVGFFTATYLNGFNVFSDTANNSQLADPIPNNPTLIGQNRYYQFYWFWGGICQPSPFYLSASKGLQITIQ